MGLFCLTPKNLIELNYTPSSSSSSNGRVADHLSLENNVTSFYNPNIARGETSSSEEAGHTPVGIANNNWALPLPLHARQRFVKPKSNSLEGLPSFHKLPPSPRSQRPRSLDELGRSGVFVPTFKMEPPQPSPTVPPVSPPYIPLAVSLPLDDTVMTDTDLEEPDLSSAPLSHSMSNSNDSTTEEQPPQRVIRSPPDRTEQIYSYNNEKEHLQYQIFKSHIQPIRGMRSPERAEQIISQEQEEVRRKCSIIALLNEEDEDITEIFHSKYPSRK
jgi:hypothetical protein